MQLNASTYRALCENEDVWLHMHIIEVATGHLKTYGLSYFPDTGFEWDGRCDDVLEDDTNGDHVFTEEEEQAFSKAADDALANFIAELDCGPILDNLGGGDGQLFTEQLLPTGGRFSAYLSIEYEP